MTRMTVLEFVRHTDGVWNLSRGLVDSFAARFPDVRFLSPPAQADADRLLPEADVVLGWAARPHNFASASRLGWIHLTAAGVGSALFPELVASEVLLTNSRGLHATSMAEHAIGMMLAFARKLHLARDAQREARWIDRALWSEPPEFRQLEGRSLGLVGLGQVGGAIARRAKALGMQVRAVTRRPRLDPAPADEVWPVERLGDLAAASDWLVIVAPSTEATRGLVSRVVLERLPAHAVVLNLGRGALIDEPALIELLERGAIAGAALDVFAEEPLPAESPLWRMPQVIVSPHVSGYGPRYWERALEMFAGNLRARLEGRPLTNVVDKREGY
jgi:phosphoglycerate dehydrogenase-like enzyme